MIRKALVSDIDVINKLGLLLDASFKEKNDLSTLIHNDVYSIYVIEDNGDICGFIMVTELYEVMDLLYIVVDPSYQHQGFGTQLLNYAILNKKTDVNKIMLEVRCNNMNAINFYKKNSFNQINIRKNYYDNNIDAIIMERSI